MAPDRGLPHAEELFGELAVEDVHQAAEMLRDRRETTHGADAFVWLELPLRLTRDPTGPAGAGRPAARGGG